MLVSLTSCLRDADDIPRAEHHSSAAEETFDSEKRTEDDGEKEPVIMPDKIPPAENITTEMRHYLDAYGDVERVILNAEQINAENARMLASATTLADILNVKRTYTDAELTFEIEKYTKPALPAYDEEDKAITSEHFDLVWDNRNLSQIEKSNTVRLGVVTSRANLRSLPDDLPYYRTPDDLYDKLQQTELHVASPVWILHESSDGKYFFVRAYNYAGWVDVRDVAVCDNEELWLSYVNPEKYARITETSVRLGGEEIDMGVKLPLMKDDGETLTVRIPVRNNEGKLVGQNVTLFAKNACIGDLPYTYKNFIIQAFKYKGISYSWGGRDTGVDCSGFISNVMRTFGFMLPRDTSAQESVVGSRIDVRGKHHADIAPLLTATKEPTAVYFKGHVLFYLGYAAEEGKYYFIHAPKIGETVSVVTKTSLAGMTYIGEFK